MDSPFLVNISDLRDRSGAPRAVEIRTSVEWQVELSRVLPHPPLDAQLTLAPTSGGYLVTGVVTVAIEHTCYRCLDVVTETSTADVAQLVADSVELEDVDYVAAGDFIDLEPVLRDEVLLRLPLRATCGSDCPGLGSRTESDLNVEAPDDEDPSSSPFGVLRDLFETGK